MAALVELEARLLRWEKGIADAYHGRGLPDGTTQWGGFEIDVFVPVATFAEAHGIRFLCPKSFAKNGGPKGTHSVYIWFEGSPVPPHIGHNSAGQTVRWKATGSGLHDLVLTPSIQEQDEGALNPCSWHGFVGSSGVPPGHAQ